MDTADGHGADFVVTLGAVGPQGPPGMTGPQGPAVQRVLLDRKVRGSNGDGASAPASYFSGNVYVSGNVSKSGGSFKIDAPPDPANKYLYHSFVESPDIMNVYNGNIATEGSGSATVNLPAWFKKLNRDFRCQLTVIGQFAQATVAAEVANNQFLIKTDKPNVKVSWQVTGIRQDAWANAHRIPVEQEKPAIEQGFYIHPELYNEPPEKSIEWATHPDAMPQLATQRGIKH